VLEFYLPDASYKPERVYYTYDSARRLNAIQYTDTRGARQLFTAEDIDPFGRVRKANHGGVATFEALYSDLGRRLLNQAAVSSIHGSRSIIYLGYDPLGRETVRREITNGALTGPKTNVGYDALGRLSSSLRTTGKFIHTICWAPAMRRSATARATATGCAASGMATTGWAAPPAT
jgi:hypothetical protein